MGLFGLIGGEEDVGELLGDDHEFIEGDDTVSVLVRLSLGIEGRRRRKGEEREKRGGEGRKK